VLADYVRTGKTGAAGSWLVEGIGEDFIPAIADLSRVTRAYSITDREAMTTARELLRKDGILAGSSSGTLIAAALRYCREQTRPKTVVTFVCDTGNKYLGKMFNDNWMNDQGLGDRPTFGDLRDLISRGYREHEVVAVVPDDPLTVIFTRMKMFDVSQLPVLDGGRVVGIVDESDLLLAVYRDRNAFERPVRDVMTTRVHTVDRGASIGELMPIFDAGLVAVVNDDQGFHGLITRIDVLNFLRTRRPGRTQGERE
jgi:cystathionine beta-synthase